MLVLPVGAAAHVGGPHGWWPCERQMWMMLLWFLPTHVVHVADHMTGCHGLLQRHYRQAAEQVVSSNVGPSQRIRLACPLLNNIVPLL
jgi:hypothetical protein